MGTDIHAFVEIDYSQQTEAFREDSMIISFNSGEVLIPRDYDLFNALGNGRNYNCEAEENIQHSLYSSRGLPKYFSDAVNSRYFNVVEDLDREYELFLELLPSLNKISSRQADRLLKEKRSFLGKPFETVRNGVETSLRSVSHPYWHSCSWLTLIEIYESLKHYNLALEEISFEFRIVLDVMEQFEQEVESGHTRLIFWFDS